MELMNYNALEKLKQKYFMYKKINVANFNISLKLFVHN